MKLLVLNNVKVAFIQKLKIYNNAYKVMEKNIPIVEPSSSKPKSDDTDDMMDEYIELESDETNNDFDLYFNRAREKIRRDEGELQPRILNWWKNREN